MCRHVVTLLYFGIVSIQGLLFVLQGSVKVVPCTECSGAVTAGGLFGLSFIICSSVERTLSLPRPAFEA
jgi:hypothetical protein